MLSSYATFSDENPRALSLSFACRVLFEMSEILYIACAAIVMSAAVCATASKIERAIGEGNAIVLVVGTQREVMHGMLHIK